MGSKVTCTGGPGSSDPIMPTPHSLDGVGPARPLPQSQAMDPVHTALTQTELPPSDAGLMETMVQALPAGPAAVQSLADDHSS